MEKLQIVRPPSEPTSLKTEMENLLQSLSPELMEAPNYDCNICADRGYVYVNELQTEGKLIGKSYTIMKPCVCKIERIRQKRLSVIPPKFQNSILSKLQPTPRHQKQKEVIEKMKSAPFDSYFFGGKFGTGKTLFMWTLYREAVMNDKKVIACTLTELLNEYKQYIQDSINGIFPTDPRLKAEDLRQNKTRYSIFLDDIDKAKPTEYAAEQFFELSDAIYAFGHQIVITTNLNLENLAAHFERADERFGGAIVRRLIDNSNVYEMF